MGADFDLFRVAVLPGAGLVVRHPGLVCVATEPDAGADDDALRTLLAICEAVGSAGRPDLGRLLARRLAGWLAEAECVPTFGTLATAGDALAVFLSGAVSVGDHDHVLISGAESAAWVDRLFPLPAEPLWLVIDGAGRAPTRPVSPWHDLRSGTAPGGGVVLTPSAAHPAGPSEAAPAAGPAAPEPAAPEPAALEPPAPEPPAPVTPEPAAQPDTTPHAVRASTPPSEAPTSRAESAPRTPVRVDAILGTPPAEPPRPPLPVAEDEDTAQAAESLAGVAVAEGYLCSRNHLNDPRSHFCVICGVRMNERTGVLTTGTRPPLGLLVFDDGAVYTVDGEYLLGREPEADKRVRAGELRPITIDDSSGTISRAHVEIRIDGWDVVVSDAGSANGTFVIEPGQSSWTALPPDTRHRLVPGTRVGLGQRSVVFESPTASR